MSFGQGFLAVDWGTTNRRAYHVAPGGAVVAEHEDGLGILSVPPGGFPAAVEELRRRFGDLPVLMGGMIGSNRGWVEAPYCPCPAGIEDLVCHIKWVEPGRVGIVPGVSFMQGETCDVMRGEEVQILGAVADGQLPRNGLVHHPGTHNKWIELREGRIVRFRTVMTGELFNLLRKHSILSDLLGQEAGIDAGFVAGLDHGLSHDDLLAELFSVRARVLLGRMERRGAASYISGLMIGGELRVAAAFWPDAPEEVTVVGRPELTALFVAAFTQAGRRARELDGEGAFVAGLRHIAEMIP